jgi:POT family proton-dependent oligopeptide transporter
MSTTTDPAPPARSDAFPPGIPFIVGNEGAERFSYYGMRAILFTYLTALFVQFADTVPAEVAAEADAHATGVTHLFFAACTPSR